MISSIGYICILKPTDKHVTCKIMNCLGSITFSNPGLDTGQIWSAAEKAHTHYTPSAIFFFLIGINVQVIIHSSATTLTRFSKTLFTTTTAWVWTLRRDCDCSSNPHLNQTMSSFCGCFALGVFASWLFKIGAKFALWLWDLHQTIES